MVTTTWYGQRDEFQPDPFTYDPPKELRGKIAHYFENTVNEAVRSITGVYDNEKFVRAIHKWLREALGVPELAYRGDFRYKYQNLIYKSETKDCIRSVEVLLNFFSNLYYNYSDHFLGTEEWTDRLDKMLQDVNRLFRNYLCGYQAEISSGEPLIKMIRMDSEFLHIETVRRPLALLRETQMSTAAEQFEEAVKEWSDENYADAITDANSAFEAAAKFILGRKSGKASQLIRELSKRGYLPPYLESGAIQLTDLMEMLPRLRDAESDAHGKLKREQWPNYARLAINLAGSLIVFLVEEWKRKGGGANKG